MAPDAIARLGAELDGPIVLISATNGKTTTAAMVAAALRAAGRPPIHNKAGSNMNRGIATALLEQRTAAPGGGGLFEVDEAWLRPVAAELVPDLIVLANLFRDQLDRYGELERLVDDWAKMLETRVQRGGDWSLVLNADDPLVSDLGRDADGAPRPGVVYFGVDDPSVSLAEPQHAHDAKHCRRCGAPYQYERFYMGHLGHYRCPDCDSARPRPSVAARRVELLGFDGSRVEVDSPAGPINFTLPLPGLYNVYNAVAASAALLQLGLGPAAIATSLEATAAVFGRVEEIQIEGRRVAILLIKNPIGASEVLRTLAQPAQPLELWIALNDKIADGRDISWVWDADFEPPAELILRVTCSGSRAPEMANRLKYAGWDPARIVVDDDLHGSFNRAVAAVEPGGRLFALPTYTALLELRTRLADRGLAKEYWA